MLNKQIPTSLEAFFGQDDRFGFADGVFDQSFFMQSVADVPVHGFPCPVALMQRQIQQRQRHLIHFVGIVFHRLQAILPAVLPQLFRSHIRPNQTLQRTGLRLSLSFESLGVARAH
jgi:hypothetical protein